MNVNYKLSTFITKEFEMRSLSGIIIVFILTFTGLTETPSAFAEGQFELVSNLLAGSSIPADYYANVFGCTAKNQSPVLEWKNEPVGTKSFAVTVFDESAPTDSGFWHYVLVDIPANVHKIDLGSLSRRELPAGSTEMMTDAGKPGYFGPCPPLGRKHTYRFSVHALKVEKLGVPALSTPAFVSFNLWANRLERASFEVTAGPRE